MDETAVLRSSQPSPAAGVPEAEFLAQDTSDQKPAVKVSIKCFAIAKSNTQQHEMK